MTFQLIIFVNVIFYSLIFHLLFPFSKVETTWKFESLLREEKHKGILKYFPN